MYKRHIGFLGVLAAAVITVACGSTDSGSGTKAKTDSTVKTDTTKEQGSGPGPGPGHDQMEKGMKMEDKMHPKEAKHP